MVPTSGWVAVVYCGFIISFFAHGVQSWYVRHVITFVQKANAAVTYR